MYLLRAVRFDLKQTKALRLWPASTFTSPFSATDTFPSIISNQLLSCLFSGVHVMSQRCASWTHYPLQMGIFRHLQHILCMLTILISHYSSLWVCSSHFQISFSAMPPPHHLFSSSVTSPPPPPLSTSSASLRASAVQISVYTSGCRLTTPQSSTPHSGEPSDADLLCMAATLEPRHIWSGVRLLKTGATLGPNKCSPAKPMRGSLLIHGPRFHPQSRSLKLLQRPRKDWIL